MREIKVYAPAKINLYLDVLNKRQDGYHNIETVFEKIDLKDELIIKERGKGVKVRVGMQECPSGKNNIVYKAIHSLFKEAKVRLNLDIQIKKRIPLAGGLGGGSSDAASTLRSVNEVFELGIPRKQLFSIASDIGKDCPFFMQDNSFAIGRGSGALLEMLNIKNSFSHIVIKPKVCFSTAQMYRKLDRSKSIHKKTCLAEVVKALKKKDINLLEKNYYNIFEEVLGRQAVYINRIKDLLSGLDVRHSFLSGSGSSVFCTFVNGEDARKVFRRMPRYKDIEVFLVDTYKGGIYGDNRG